MIQIISFVSYTVREQFDVNYDSDTNLIEYFRHIFIYLSREYTLYLLVTYLELFSSSTLRSSTD